MPSYKLYKILHLTGVVLACMTTGAFAYHALLGGTKEAAGRARKMLLGGHGVGLLLILIGGMGAGATAGLFGAGLPWWVSIKLALWMALGALPALPYRRPGSAAHILWVVPVLVALGAWAAGGFMALTR